jgi:hypothetical protein
MPRNDLFAALNRPPFFFIVADYYLSHTCNGVQMEKEYRPPLILYDGKRYALRHHVARYSGYYISIINRLIDQGKIASYLINFKVYIDLDEALTVLSQSRFSTRRSAAAAAKILSPEQRADLFV